MVSKLPLLDLFNSLREAGLPLGVKDYDSLLRALQAGYGLPDTRALAELCQVLWVRSPDEQRLFDYYFEQLITSQESSLTKSLINPLELETKIKQVNTYWFPRRTTLVKLTIIGASIAILFTSSDNQLNTSIEKSIPIQPSGASPSVQQSTDYNQQMNWTDWRLLFLLLLSAGCIGCLKLLIKQRNNRNEKLLRQPKLTPIAELSRDLLFETQDAVKIAQTIHQITGCPENRLNHYFLVSTDYLPVTQRQMKQSWRYLRQLIREGPSTELDIEATVKQISQQGSLLNPVLIPQRVNRSALLLLIDQDGSMVPFHALSTRLANTALRGGRLGKADIYYFHNCPVRYIYKDQFHQKAESVNAVLAHLVQARTVVLIFSDAGAARGSLNPERLRLTAAFLNQVNQYVRYVAWLNPIPRNRWIGTTAGEIALLTPMFEATRQGLDRAISTLRGCH